MPHFSYRQFARREQLPPGGVDAAAQGVRSALTGKPMDGLHTIFAVIGGGLSGGVGAGLSSLFKSGGAASTVAKEALTFFLADSQTRAVEAGVRCGTK
jgi:hypothetical protein